MTMNSEKCFFDTNIMVYAVSGDPTRESIANTLLARRGTISVQVLNEFISVSRKKHSRGWSEVKRALDAVKVVCDVVSVSPDTQAFAVSVAESTGINIYDACIVAAAELAGCDVLYTEDLNHGQRIGRVEIRNPFK